MAEEYQGGELLDIHRETLSADGLKNIYPQIGVADGGNLQLNLRLKGRGYDVTEPWTLHYNFGPGKSGGHNWFNQQPTPMGIQAGDRVCLLCGNYQEGNGSTFVDPMFFTLSPMEALNGLEGYTVLLWAEFGGPAVDYGMADEDGISSAGVTGMRTQFWAPTNVPTVQTSTFTFQNLQAATLRISHYQKGKLLEQQELPFTGLELYGMALHQKENTWTAIASAYHDRHGGGDDWISISFPADGQVYLSSYCDDSNTNNFVLSPNRTYYLAAAAWSDIAYPPQDYQTNPDLIACADHLVLYELDAYASGDDLPEANVIVWSDKQMEMETHGGLGAVYNFSQLHDATLRLKHYQKGKLVDEQSCAAEKMRQLTVCAFQDENIGKWRVLALDAGGVNYSPTPRQGETQEWKSPNAVVDRDDAPSFSGDWLPLVREGAENENVITILSGGNTYCFAAFAWGKDRDYYCEEYLVHPEFCSKPDELVLLELELP